MNQQIEHVQTFSTAMGTLAITADQAAAVIDAIGNAQARNTIRAHESRLMMFRGWLAGRGMQLIDGVAVDAAIIATYLCDRWTTGRKITTIDADLAAIGWWHSQQGIDSPSRTEPVRKVMSGLRRKTSKAIKDGDTERRAVRADAVLADHIVQMIRAIDAQAVNESMRLRDRAMILLGFALGTRRSELAGLRPEHIIWHQDGIEVQIWNAKTGDRTAEAMYDADPNLCAITAVRRWMDHAGITSGPLFRQIIVTPRGDRRAVISQDGIAGQVVNRTFQKWAQAAGLPAARWTSHSMRAGFIVQAETDGISESQIRAQTGHRSGHYYDYAQRKNVLSARRNASLGSVRP